MEQTRGKDVYMFVARDYIISIIRKERESDIDYKTVPVYNFDVRNRRLRNVIITKTIGVPGEMRNAITPIQKDSIIRWFEKRVTPEEMKKITNIIVGRRSRIIGVL